MADSVILFYCCPVVYNQRYLTTRSLAAADTARDAGETATQGHSRSSVVAPIDAAYYDFQLALNSNLISTISRS